MEEVKENLLDGQNEGFTRKVIDIEAEKSGKIRVKNSECSIEEFKNCFNVYYSTLQSF